MCHRLAIDSCRMKMNGAPGVHGKVALCQLLAYGIAWHGFALQVNWTDFFKTGAKSQTKLPTFMIKGRRCEDLILAADFSFAGVFFVIFGGAPFECLPRHTFRTRAPSSPWMALSFLVIISIFFSYLLLSSRFYRFVVVSS